MSLCKNCKYNQGPSTDQWGSKVFVCMDKRGCRWTVPIEYLEKEMVCPDYEKVEE